MDGEQKNVVVVVVVVVAVVAVVVAAVVLQSCSLLLLVFLHLFPFRSFTKKSTIRCLLALLPTPL